MKKTILAAAMALALASPAHAQTQADLLGNWRCDLNSPTLVMSITTTYMADGEFTSIGASQAQTPNGRLDMRVAATGAWTLQNGQLTEQVQHSAIFSAALDGVAIPPEAPGFAHLHNQFAAGSSQPNVRTLISVTPDAYTITFEGHQQTCHRRR